MNHTVRPLPDQPKFGIWQSDLNDGAGGFASSMGLDVPDSFDTESEAHRALGDHNVHTRV